MKILPSLENCAFSSGFELCSFQLKLAHPFVSVCVCVYIFENRCAEKFHIIYFLFIFFFFLNINFAQNKSREHDYYSVVACLNDFHMDVKYDGLDYIYFILFGSWFCLCQLSLDHWLHADGLWMRFICVFLWWSSSSSLFFLFFFFIAAHQSHVCLQTGERIVII